MSERAELVAVEGRGGRPTIEGVFLDWRGPQQTPLGLQGRPGWYVRCLVLLSDGGFSMFAPCAGTPEAAIREAHEYAKQHVVEPDPMLGFSMWRAGRNVAPKDLAAADAERREIERLRAGLARLEAEPATFQKYNAENGWGRYEHLVEFVRKYLEACERYPDAKVRVSR